MANDEENPPDTFLYTGKERIPRNVRRAEVHRSVKFIPAGLFKDCDRLESALLPEGMRNIGRDAFDGCSSLRSVRCPSAVTHIGSGAFYECFNLASVELPEGLEEIGDWTFSECTSLARVRIPASVARIGRSAFWECTNLASVELREGLRTIGRKAFKDCRSLEDLAVPLSVEEICEEAFDGCVRLSLVNLHEDLPKIKKDAFGGCPLESFRFVRLSERTEAIRMDDRTKSMFHSRLSEITLAITRANSDDEDEDDWEWDEDDWGRDREEEARVCYEKCTRSLGRAHEVLTYLELKGGVPVLELALWKTKITGEGEDGAQGDFSGNRQDRSDVARERKRPKVIEDIGRDTQPSRTDCRVKCGADIVSSEVLKFFAYRMTWPRLDD